MIGYKVARNDNDRVIVTLEIPDDALTDMNRRSIIVKETAQYRANKVKVLKIEDSDGKEYTEAESMFYPYACLKYTVGETAVDNYFCRDIEKREEGIYFFLSREVAERYGLGTVENGIHKMWHPNGVLEEEFECVNGKHHGKYTSYHDNGVKNIECVYENGALAGVFRRWHENGTMFYDGYC